MAKLQTYKFVNPGVSNVKSPIAAAARKQTLALNRLGSTISGIGSVVSDIEKISIAQIKNEKLRERAERRKERREADEAAEEAIENKKATRKTKPKISKTSLKIVKGSLSWIEKFLAPIGKFFGYLAKIAISTGVLDWVSNPDNINKLTEFLEKTHFVFKKLFGWAAGFTNNILDGFSALTDPNSTFIQRLGGVGKMMTGIIGLKYLMNPFSLITDILGLIDLLTGYDPLKSKKLKGKQTNKPTKKNPSGANPDVDGPRGRPRVKTVTDRFGNAAGKQYRKILAEYGDDAARAYLNALELNGGNPTKALQSWKRLKLKKVEYKPTRIQKVGDFFGGLFDKGVKSLTKGLPSWAKKQYSNLDSFRQKQWQKIVSIGEGIKNTGITWASKAKNKFNRGIEGLKSGTRKLFTDRVLTPLRPIIEPIGRQASKIGSSMINQLMKIPGMDKAVEVLNKKGISSFNAIASAGKKLGARASAILPVVGGLVNLAFAYQRFSAGDSIGGLIEGTAGILDILGLFTGGGTSALSMLMDGYMFVRDFVPQLQQNEERIIDAVGARGLKDGIDRILSKLPGIGQLVSTLVGGGTDEEKTKVKTVKTESIKSDLTSMTVDGGTEKNQWWDFLDVFPNKSKPKDKPKDEQTEGTKKNQWWDFLDIFPNKGEPKSEEKKKKNFWSGLFSKGEPKKSEPEKKKKKGLFGLGFLGLEDGGKLPEFFIGGLFKGIGKAVSGVVKGVGKVVGGVVNTVGKIASNPIVGTALSFIPGMQIPMAVINAGTALSQGNVMGALSAGLGGLGAFANINTVNAISQPQWLQNLRFSGFGQGVANMYHSGLNAFNNLSAGFNNFMNSKVGSIASDVLSGNYLGALNTLNPKIGGIAQNIMSGNYGGALSAFNPELGAAVSKGIALVDSFRQDPMGLLAGVAEANGMGGILKAVTGLFGGGDKVTAVTQIAAEMGVDPKLLGVVDSVNKRAMREGGISAEFAIEQAMEFIPIPIIIEKIVPIPQAVGINIGGGNQIVITAPNSLLDRMR